MATKLEKDYEQLAETFGQANIAYNRRVREVGGDETDLPAEERLAFIDLRTDIDAKYAEVITAQASKESE